MKTLVNKNKAMSKKAWALNTNTNCGKIIIIICVYCIALMFLRVTIIMALTVIQKSKYLKNVARVVIYGEKSQVSI
jgi:hypothetical protein